RTPAKGPMFPPSLRRKEISMNAEANPAPGSRAVLGARPRRSRMPIDETHGSTLLSATSGEADPPGPPPGVPPLRHRRPERPFMYDPRPIPWMNPELAIFRHSVRRFLADEAVPNNERWRKQRRVDREFYLKAGKMGILCPSIPEEYGGGGGTYAHEAIIS